MRIKAHGYLGNSSLKPVIIIAIAFVLLIPITVFAEPYVATVKDTGVDIFTDKIFYEIGGDVILGITLDPEKFVETEQVGVTIWDIHNDRRSLYFDVNPQENYYYSYTLDESFSGEVKVEVHAGDRNVRDWWDEYYFYVGVDDVSNDDLVHARIGLGNVIQETNPPDYVYLNSMGGIGSEYTSEEIQARAEIPFSCNIDEPQIDPRWQGDIGMNNPQYMDAVRDAQSQYMNKIQQCQNDYQKLIEPRVAELNEQRDDAYFPEPGLDSSEPEPTTPTYEELLAENQPLKEKIENLNQLVLEQLRIIVEWINK